MGGTVLLFLSSLFTFRLSLSLSFFFLQKAFLIVDCFISAVGGRQQAGAQALSLMPLLSPWLATLQLGDGSWTLVYRLGYAVQAMMLHRVFSQGMRFHRRDRSAIPEPQISELLATGWHCTGNTRWKRMWMKESEGPNSIHDPTRLRSVTFNQTRHKTDLQLPHL